MSEAVDCNDTALAQYNRMVVSIEVDEEEELIQQSREALEQGQTLPSIWHQINSKIAPQRVLPVLKKIMQDRRNNVSFLCMTTTDTTQGEIGRAIKKWDVLELMFKERRAKGAQQSNKQDDRSPRQNYLPQQRQSYPPLQRQPGEKPRQQDQRRIPRRPTISTGSTTYTTFPSKPIFKPTISTRSTTYTTLPSNQYLDRRPQQDRRQERPGIQLPGPGQLAAP